MCCLGEFKEPTCIIIKHNNPCGVASSTDIKKSFINAYNSDTMSSFGGIVLFSKLAAAIWVSAISIGIGTGIFFFWKDA